MRIYLVLYLTFTILSEIAAAAEEETPYELTCAIEEYEEEIHESILVTHQCYGIRGHAVVHIAEIEITDPRLRFKTTEGRARGDFEFSGQKTSTFARLNGLLIAINAGYFEPFDSGSHGDAYPQEGDPVNVMGQHIRDGVIVSDNDIAIPRFRLRVDGAFCATWNSVNVVNGVCPPGTQQAIGSGPIIMLNGQTPSFQKFDARFSIKRAPRTVIAHNQDRSKLWFIVADGRQEGYSQGMNLPELADLVRDLGAWSALNLDGGGSAVMVGVNGDILSRPIQQRNPGQERVVANHIGIFVESLP